ncbi:MAG: putative ABC transporter permease [Firmicutes bacterium]|nr:putative ABC transporter permease [Bacillota bacterium]
MAKILKYLFLFSFGGIIYLLIELIWRGYSHWSMFALGGFCFLMLGLINEKYTRDIPLIIQMLIGAFVITLTEFIAGCILNLWLKLNVWDYYNMPYNIMGQICLPYMILWFFLSPVCIITDDYIRYLFFDGERPRYRIF